MKQIKHRLKYQRNWSSSVSANEKKHTDGRKNNTGEGKVRSADAALHHGRQELPECLNQDENDGK